MIFQETNCELSVIFFGALKLFLADDAAADEVEAVFRFNGAFPFARGVPGRRNGYFHVLAAFGAGEGDAAVFGAGGSCAYGRFRGNVSLCLQRERYGLRAAQAEVFGAAVVFAVGLGKELIGALQLIVTERRERFGRVDLLAAAAGLRTESFLGAVGISGGAPFGVGVSACVFEDLRFSACVSAMGAGLGGNAVLGAGGRLYGLPYEGVSSRGGPLPNAR